MNDFTGFEELTPEEAGEEAQEPGWFERVTWGVMKKFAVAVVEQMWAGFQPMTINVMQDAENKLMDKLGLSTKKDWERMLEFYRNAGLLSQEHVDLLMKMKDLPMPWEQLNLIKTSFALMNTMTGTTAEAGSNLMRQQFNKDLQIGRASCRERV